MTLRRVACVVFHVSLALIIQSGRVAGSERPLPQDQGEAPAPEDPGQALLQQYSRVRPDARRYEKVVEKRAAKPSEEKPLEVRAGDDRGVLLLIVSESSIHITSGGSHTTSMRCRVLSVAPAEDSPSGITFSPGIGGGEVEVREVGDGKWEGKIPVIAITSPDMEPGVVDVAVKASLEGHMGGGSVLILTASATVPVRVKPAGRGMPGARERVACCYRTLEGVLRDLPAAWEKIRDRVTKSSWNPDKKKQRGAVSHKKLQEIRKQAVLANLLVAELEMHASSESDVSEAARSLLDLLHERTEVADLFGDLVAKGAIPASPLALAKDAGA